MRMLTVRPRDGATILNPDRGNRPLNPAGEKVPLTVYWQRRLKDGDVVEVRTASPRARRTKAD